VQSHQLWLRDTRLLQAYIKVSHPLIDRRPECCVPPATNSRRSCATSTMFALIPVLLALAHLGIALPSSKYVRDLKGIKQLVVFGDSLSDSGKLYSLCFHTTVRSRAMMQGTELGRSLTTPGQPIRRTTGTDSQMGRFGPKTLHLLLDGSFMTSLLEEVRTFAIILIHY
jgi:hypothetical protein